MCCRKGGTVSIPGVYIGMVDKMPDGRCDEQRPDVEDGQTHVPHYHHKLLERIEAGEIDPSFVVTHSRPLEDGPELYKTFREKEDGCIKVVLKP
jgi:threonine dehydrogenase-like Zn-dependent dehydrogenase